MSETKEELTKTLAILVSGKAGVGKTTLSKQLYKYLIDKYNFEGEIVPFAQSLKVIAKRDFGWDGVKDDKGRLLLQSIGRIGREYDKDIWVKSSVNKFYSGSPFIRDFVIFDDWRFPNEFDYLRNKPEFKVISIRIESPDREILRGTEAYRDVSETSLPAFDFTEEFTLHTFVRNIGIYDIVINNVLDLDTMYHIADTWIDKEIQNLAFKPY